MLYWMGYGTLFFALCTDNPQDAVGTAAVSFLFLTAHSLFGGD